LSTIAIDLRLTYYRQGGIAEYMRQLLAALTDLSPPQKLLALHNFRMDESLGNRVNCYTPSHHRLESIALGLELLPRRIDLLHSPDFIPPKFGAKKYVITVHDLAFLLYEDIQTADSLRYYAGGIRRAVRQADRIIAVSAATRDDLMRLLDIPSQKISVIWEGLHPQFRPIPDDEARPVLDRYHLPEKYMLFVGTIEPRKNIPNLLRAFAMLKDRPKLVLAGQKGWLSDETFDTIHKLNLGEEVIWLDGVPFADLPALYSGAMLHILPSLYEGFGFPPLEAMACGTATIVSDRGALREISGEAAIFIDPDSPESIAAAIEALLRDDTQRTEQVTRGLDHVKQFTWRSTAEKTLALYQEVLNA
jgi:glycosyltransferase involved in cell wall biosynthesis